MRGLFLGGWTATAGLALDWFRTELGPVEDVHSMDAGAGGVLALPYFAGERTPVWDPRATGAFVGLSLATRRADLYRALVDGIALSARHHLELLKGVGLAPSRWRASGGGTQDEAWLCATCDALGAPLDVVAHAEKAVGPAVLALRGLWASTSRFPPFARSRPIRRRCARFDELDASYRELYAATAPVMHRLSRSER